MKVAFWNIDTQKDFIEKDGKLSIEGATEIKPYLKRLTDLANKLKITVINTADLHTDKSKEIGLVPDFITSFPAHCMINTDGAEFIEETNPKLIDHSYYICNYYDDKIEKNINTARNIIIHKDNFDVFAGNPHTKTILELINPHLVVVYGVATNVCVDFAVRGLLERGRNVIVVKEAIKELPNIPIKPTIERWLDEGAILENIDVIEKNLEKII